MPRCLALSFSLAMLAWSSAALADDSDPGTLPHEGFYLSVAIGPSYLSSDMTTSGDAIKDLTTGATSSSQSTTISSLGLGGQLLLGGTPSPNLVGGGGTMGVVLFSPTRSWNGNSRPLHGYSFGLIGPFVDYMIEPKLALHVQVLAGAADASENSQGSTATTLWGYGASFGIGAGTWVSRSLALGLLVRGQLAHLSTTGIYSSSPGNPDLFRTVDSNLTESQTIWAGGLLVELTYH